LRIKAGPRIRDERFPASASPGYQKYIAFFPHFHAPSDLSPRLIDLIDLIDLIISTFSLWHEVYRSWDTLGEDSPTLRAMDATLIEQ